MSDFTMCQNSECPLKFLCRRWPSDAVKDGWQSYSYFIPHADGKACEHFYGKKKTKSERKL
jgi:hypothetical protein